MTNDVWCGHKTRKSGVRARDLPVLGLNGDLGIQHRKEGTGNGREVSGIETARLSDLLSQQDQGKEVRLIKFWNRQLTYYHPPHFGR